MNREIMERPLYIASCSFGKDSLATILLARDHKEPLDMVVYCEVMFDASRGISGENPEHIQWVREVAIPKIEHMGYPVKVLRRKEKDFCSIFYHVMGDESKYKGKCIGFPIGGKCTINRELKTKPIHDFCRSLGDREVVQYIGIAIDESVRLERLHNGQTSKRKKVSLMEKYGVTEAQAMDMCRAEGLLSPTYKTGNRGGCWFCMNRPYREMNQFRKDHPDLWGELKQCSLCPNMIKPTFKYNKTFPQVEEILDAMDRQLTLF